MLRTFVAGSWWKKKLMAWVCNELMSVCSRFANDRRGVFAIMFAILALPLLTGVFIAIDYSRATSVKSSLQSAADAAIFSAAMRLGGDEDEVRGAFKKSFQANLPEKLKDQPFSLSIAKDEKSLHVKMDASINTTLIRVAGIEQIKFGIEAFANKPKLKLPTLARAGNGDGDGDASVSDERALKEQLMREIQEGLRAARRAGIPVQDNIDQRQLERLAESVHRYMKSQGR